MSLSIPDISIPQTGYSGPTPQDLLAIPAALQTYRHWVLWRGVDKVDPKTGEITLNKIPYNARTLHKAMTTNAETWSTCAEAVAALPRALAAWEQECPDDYRGGGLGFVFAPADPFCGIDLDHCRDPETGELDPWAAAIIAQVDSYSEASPTGTGAHLIAEGSLPPGDRKRGRVEMYTEGRFFTMTGRHLPMTPPTIEARQEAITAVHAAHVARKAAPTPPSRPALPLNLDDMVILAKARAAQNGAKFAALWAGDTSQHDGDDSAADEALCCALAFWTRDASQIDRLFRGSGLMRDKWDETRGKQTYGARTIAQALRTVGASYDPEAWLETQIAAKQGRQSRGKAAHPRSTPAPDATEHAPRGADAASGQDPDAPPHAIFIEAADIEEEDITWIWEPYVARKKLHAMDGDPGIGKTLFALQLAACVSRGYPMPDQLGRLTLSTGAPSRVLLIGLEDGLGDTVIKRLKRADADLSKIAIVNEVDENDKPRPFLLSDLPTLERHMEERRPAVVYIDSLQAVLGGKVDINRANQVTEMLLPLRKFAERYQAAIIFTRHPAKPGQNIAKLIHRGMGSQAFIGSARLGLFVEEHPSDPTKALLVQSKSNAGAIGRTHIFSKRAGQFEWCGVTRLSKEMMAGSGKGPSPQAFLETCLWLEARLRDGRAYPAAELQEEMKEEGFAHGSIFAAKKALGVVHSKLGIGAFTWYLPPLSTPSTSSTSTTSSTSSTSYSSDKTSIYTDTKHGEEARSEVVDVSEVDEVDEVYEVDGVVTDPDAEAGRERFRL